MKEEKFLSEQQREIMNYVTEESYRPLKFNSLVSEMKINKNNRDNFKKNLKELEDLGEIVKNRKNQFQIPGNDIKVGVFSSTQKGFGFLDVEGEIDDIFIPETDTSNALHGDKVVVRIKESKTGKRQEGSITRVLERATSEIVGTFQKSKNFGFLVADNTRIKKDFFVSREQSSNAKTGDKVVATITNYGSKEKNPEARVTEILGRVGEPGVDIMSIIRGHDLPVEFSDEVKQQLASIPKKVSESDKQGRKKVEGQMIITIDGEDAKDLDDAITIEKKDGNYHLGVHIADVSHYVPEGSALDKDALNRGTSIYLIDRVIPMLPTELSNGICSLNVGEDRLALSCFITMDSKGTIIDHKIEETIINVDHRLSYNYVADVLEEREILDNNNDLLEMLKISEELAGVLKEKRRKRGSINFEFPESLITLDEEGIPTDIRANHRNIATKIIEEFMLVTNEVIGENYFWQDIPFLYRTHDVPDAEKIKTLAIFINTFGYTLKTSQEEVHPKELQRLLTKVIDTDEESLISRLTLRSMKQAKYTSTNSGHFGLSAKYYSHFTAPIRRYPDLQIHRIIKDNITSKLSPEKIKHYQRFIDQVANHSSKTERRAEEAEREVYKLKKVQYMEQFIGEEFDGVIGGITSWGIYVELPNTVEGMVHVTSLEGDFYNYDETNFQMVGEHTNKTYKLGQKVRIKVKDTDMVLRNIDFEMVEEVN